MIRRNSPRCDLSLRRNNLAGLMAACAAGWVLLWLGALHRTTWGAHGIRLHEQRAQAAEEKIDPNTASMASLRRLPGIGVELAARIVHFRAGKDRPFGTIRDLTQVKGIGAVKAERLQPYTTLPQGP